MKWGIVVHKVDDNVCLNNKQLIFISAQYYAQLDHNVTFMYDCTLHRDRTRAVISNRCASYL